MEFVLPQPQRTFIIINLPLNLKMKKMKNWTFMTYNGQQMLDLYQKYCGLKMNYKINDWYACQSIYLNFLTRSMAYIYISKQPKYFFTPISNQIMYYYGMYLCTIRNVNWLIADISQRPCYSYGQFNLFCKNISFREW